MILGIPPASSGPLFIEKCGREAIAGRRRSVLRMHGWVGALFFVAAVFDARVSAFPAFAVSDALLGVGCLVSALAEYRSENRRRGLWFSAYAALWAGTLFALGSSGGALSPFFVPYMVLVLLCGVCLLTHVHPSRIYGFVAANAVGWFVGTMVFDLKALEVPRHLMFMQTVVLLLAAMGTVIQVVTSWKKQLAEFRERERRLFQAESQLVHVDKMAEVGKLVATTAHELAQPTQVIVTASSLLHRFVTRKQTDFASLELLSERLRESSDRLSRLLFQLKNFSRKETSVVKTKLDLREPLLSVHLLTQHDLKSRSVHYRVDVPSHPLWTSGDLHRLQQVFLNLVNNARDAALTVRQPRVSVSVGRYREWVRVTVSNNGTPIPLEVQTKLFEPYFTTKSRGEGTGLGLSICRQLIEEHGGRILFSSSGEQTMFVVDLPAVVPAADEEALAGPGLKISSGSAPLGVKLG